MSSPPLPEPTGKPKDAAAPSPLVGNYTDYQQQQQQQQPQPTYDYPPPPQGPLQPGYPPVAPGESAKYPPPPPGMYYDQGASGIAMPGAPPPGMFPAQGMPVYQPPAVVTVVQPSHLPPPAHVVCAGCHKGVSPFKTYETGFLTWIVAGGLCFVGLFCCAPIPFCTDCTKDERYACPSCGTTLAHIKRI